MYDALEIARCDRQAALNVATEEGEIKVRIETIQDLQRLLGEPAGDEQELRELTLEQLKALTRSLEDQLRNRMPA
jgi:DNA-binding PucR family transcriptional regulator